LRKDHRHGNHRQRTRDSRRAKAILVSMQNGVDNAEQIHAASGLNALAAVVYVAASVPAPGTVKHVGRGDLVLGPENPSTRRVAEIFLRANVPAASPKTSPANSGPNSSGIAPSTRSPPSAKLLTAKSSPVPTPKNSSKAPSTKFSPSQKLRAFNRPASKIQRLPSPAAYKIAEQMSATRSSTSQDMMRGKHTEIDSLNGFIARKGRELGVPLLSITPSSLSSNSPKPTWTLVSVPLPPLLPRAVSGGGRLPRNIFFSNVTRRIT